MDSENRQKCEKERGKEKGMEGRKRKEMKQSRANDYDIIARL